MQWLPSHYTTASVNVLLGCLSVVYIRICSPRPLMKSIQSSCSAFTNKQAGIHALACQLSTGSSLSGRFPGVFQRPSSFLVYRTDKITLLSWCGRWLWNPRSKCPTVLSATFTTFQTPVFPGGMLEMRFRHSSWIWVSTFVQTIAPHHYLFLQSHYPLTCSLSFSG